MQRKMKSKKMMSSRICSNPTKMIMGKVIIAIGILIGIQGFALQLQLGGTWGSDPVTIATVFVYYLIAAFLIACAKKCCGSCCSSCSM